ncbi:uncharacterized protein [Diadema setosum]|uniref:uncharacterized protein n=1 Tax=Diadema setosum TaxID=31175 RepID=UPI003B3A735A
MDRDYTYLVLLLAVLVSVDYCPVSEASVVETVPDVQEWTRKDIRLPCHSEKVPLAVFWTKESTSNQTVETMKASFFDGYFASEEERFNIDVNYNLVITDLQVADEGRYYCQLMWENFEILLNFTNLTVSAPVVDTLPTIQGWKGRDIQLPCDFKEEPLAVYWVKESMSQPELSTSKAFYDGDYVSMEQRFDIDKNFDLLITDLEVADEGLYHCQLVFTTFENFSNSTLMTVNSKASEPAIEECVDKLQPNSTLCTHQTPFNTSSIDFTCVVSGFKPNVTMFWTEESGKRLYSVVSQQITLPDDTYERFETITVSAKNGEEQTFMCTATGDSLNGTSTAEITVLPIPGPRDRHIIIIGLVIGVTVALVTLFFLAGKILQKYYPDYLPAKGCGWNPCWRRPSKPDPADVEAELLNSKRKQREELRQKIRGYQPGKARYDKRFNAPSKVNISFFGEIAAGKSCLINSLNFALNGNYSTVTKEGIEEDGGRKTRRRFHHILAERIDLIDTCGIQNFSSDTLERLKEECSTNSLTVLTHKDDIADPKTVRNQISRFRGKKRILMFENYTTTDNEENLEKDVKYLQFLWSALQICDETIKYRKKAGG